MFDFFSKLFKKKGVAATAGEKKAEVKSDEPLNLSIHVMPKRFMEAAATARSSKNAGLFILFGGIILMLALGGGAYYFFVLREPAQKKAEPIVTPAVEEKDTAAEAAEKLRLENLAKIEDAKKSYVAFKTELGSIATIDDYAEFLNSRAEGEFLSGWINLKDQADKLSDEEKEQFAAVIKSYQPKIAEIDSLLTGQLQDGNAYFTATSSSLDIRAGLVQSGGIWKVVSEGGFTYYDEKNATTTPEEWIIKHASTTLPENETELKPGIDTDADGLTDLEEGALGTKTTLSDTDADGYSDISELFNLYNPAGAGKLIDNSGISAYSDANFNFEVLVPKAWTIKKGSGNDSLVFQSADNQFLQIIIQPNANKEDILSWYKSQFEGITASEVELSKRGTNDDLIWEGMKSKDGLTIYITNPAKEYIYVLSYSPGEATILEYKNFLELMLKSLQFK